MIPFSLEIKPEIARKMTRIEYYQTKSWLRSARRELLKVIRIEEKDDT